MKIIVCMKHSIQPEYSGFGNIENNKIPEEDLKYGTSEFDNYALQLGISFKKTQNCEVTAVTIGPERATAVLFEAIALGADRAIHVNADLQIPSDPYMAAGILKEIVKDEAPDLILTGAQSVDDNNSITHALLGALLGVPSVLNVCRYEQLNDNEIEVCREKEKGLMEIVSVPLPAVLSIQTGIVQLKYASFAMLRRAKKQEINTIQLGSLKIDTDKYRKWEYVSLYEKAPEKNTVVIDGDLTAKARTFIEVLRNEVKLKI